MRGVGGNERGQKEGLKILSMVIREIMKPPRNNVP